MKNNAMQCNDILRLSYTIIKIYIKIYLLYINVFKLNYFKDTQHRKIIFIKATIKDIFF